MDNNFLKLKNKVVVITGANGQLGSATCNFFKDLGSKVVGLDIEFEKKFKLTLTDAFELDIIKESQVKTIMESIFKRLGKIDILINNAGVSIFEPFEERKEEKFDWVMDVNLKGSFNCIKNYVNLFDKYRMNKGSIINIASIYGLISPDFRIYDNFDRKNSEIYGATKAGIIQMTKYFSTHLAARNIRCNAVSPGGIFNPKNPQSDKFVEKYSYRCPMNRMAKTEEIVGAILYLASDIASYTTGQNITVDGGMSAW